MNTNVNVSLVGNVNAAAPAASVLAIAPVGEPTIVAPAIVAPEPPILVPLTVDDEISSLQAALAAAEERKVRIAKESTTTKE